MIYIPTTKLDLVRTLLKLFSPCRVRTGGGEIDDGARVYATGASPYSLLPDPDLLVGEAIELVADLVDEPVGFFDPRQEEPERRHRVIVFPAQVVLEPGAAWDRRPASACSSCEWPGAWSCW